MRPPWQEFPESDPWWSGWRQGVSEHWLRSTWLPFWKALSSDERVTYLTLWPPPSDDWRTFLTEQAR